MTEESLRKIVKRFDPRSLTKNTPDDVRELAKAGLAYEVPGAPSIFVLNDAGRAILYALPDYRSYRSVNPESVEVLS